MDLNRETTEGLLGLDRAASALADISPWTLRKHVARGTVAVTRIGRRTFIAVEEIRRISREGLPSLKSQSSPRPQENKV
jgi:hypothetical protein